MSNPALQPRSDVVLADFTTWRVGGPAQWLLEPTSLDETIAALTWAHEQKLPCRVIGAGSNLLVHDDGLQGLTLSLRRLQGATLDPKTGHVARSISPAPNCARKDGGKSKRGAKSRSTSTSRTSCLLICARESPIGNAIT